MRDLTIGINAPSAQTTPTEAGSNAYRNLTKESLPRERHSSRSSNHSVPATTFFHFFSKACFVWRPSSLKSFWESCPSTYEPCSKTKRHFRYSSNVSAALCPITIERVNASCLGIVSARAWHALSKASAVRKMSCGLALLALASFGFTVSAALFPDFLIFGLAASQFLLGNRENLLHSLTEFLGRLLFGRCWHELNIITVYAVCHVLVVSGGSEPPPF